MAKKKLIVGITCYGRAKIPDRYSVPIDYVKAIQRAGASAVLLPPGGPEVLDAVQALVLAGGGDIDPRHYGGLTHPTLYGIDDERDDFELAVAAEAFRRGMPMLAICRGLQIVNVLQGGTLHPHLEEHRGENGSITHTVEAQPGSLLCRVIGETTFPVRSSHHQAVDKAGDGLTVSARAQDGTVEALDVAGNPAALAVQWHPEESAATDPRQQRLFDWLVSSPG